MAFDVRLNESKLTFDVNRSIADIEALVAQGGSFVGRFEELRGFPSQDAVAQLGRAGEQVSGLPTSVHLYVSGAGRGALKPHTGTLP